jgi:orotate phosphoribosyltransferase
MTTQRTSQTQHAVARALLDIGAVGFRIQQPITFKSGILSPVYVDNRIFPSFPNEWQTVINGFVELIHEKQIEFDMFAGIETAGIPHSAVLGYIMKKPSVFIRKKTKDHGTKKMIEGGNSDGKTVLLIEDLVTTGGSSMHGVNTLRENNAAVNDCLVIVSYGFSDSVEAFVSAHVNLHSLTTFPIILEEAFKQKIITQKEKETVEEWLQNPWQWGKTQ